MNNKIDFAFFDSGTGGIPYMLALKEKSPNSRFVYLGDTVHFPYGEKSAQEITDCASASITKIVNQWNPKILVIACNTISVTALNKLRQNFPNLTIIGTVPAIKLAAKVSKNKKIGLLATNAAINHPYCKKLAEDFASGCQVINRGDPDLISFIEHDLFTATKEKKLLAVKPAVDFFVKANCDTIILGCTHFTHLANEISEVFSKSVDYETFVVDSREGVSNHALEIFNSTINKTNDTFIEHPDMSFFVTKLKDKNDQMEYEMLCKNFDITFGGVLE